jgi:bifunctional non-homologous end joining protein LigD
MGLADYRRKRDFSRTPEPAGKVRKRSRALAFVVQKHDASRLHYDFRLEHHGVLKSWAVPKGPSLDPADRRLAVQVEDHPLDYGGFEGVIPEGEYGAGPVIVWDRGRWIPTGDVEEGLRKGKLEFELEGEKLAGAWRLIRLHGPGNESGKNWLLVKHGDEAARPASKYALTEARPESVLSRRRIEELDGKARTKTKAKASRKAAPQRAAARASTPARRAGRERKSGRRAAPRARTKARRSRRLDAALARLSAAKRTGLPSFVKPQLATLVREAPAGDGWLHEIKFDGYRMLARLDNGRVRWLSRNGLDWTRRFAALTPSIEALGAQSALLDGEVVAVQPDGTTSFHALQTALSEGRSDVLTFYAFDLLHLDGVDLRRCTLEERKEVLGLLLGVEDGDGDPTSAVRFSKHIAGEGPAFYRQACNARLEGILSKRRDQPYASGRSRDWLKIKCAREQELVVIGFTKPGGSRVGLGALVLGYYEDGRLKHAGRVGTGFGRKMLLDLRQRLKPLVLDRPPVAGPLPAAARRGVTWVRPELVAEVGFTEWTSDGMLRHPTFKGLREDKPASEVVREKPAATPAPKSSGWRRAKSAAKAPRARAQPAKPARARASEAQSAEVAGIEITHPERVVYPELGVTKLELARYYESVAERILPHIAGRPLSVVRCPRGAGAPCFFQKHGHGHFPDAVKAVEVEEGSGKALYLMVDSLPGLIAVVQMGAMELHPWGSRADRLEHPDVMIFDLDPAEGVPWKSVTQSALLLRGLLEHLGLESFLKTTGGKGLHVVVPLARRQGWDEVKAFSRNLAEQMERAAPELYLSTASKAKRKGRIFVDYLRNARGATAVAPYSSRARAGATVAVPLHWSEIERDPVRADAFDVRNLARRLERRGFRDPWAAFFRVKQALRLKPALGAATRPGRARGSARSS